jgi:hypothetical protein
MIQTFTIFFIHNLLVFTKSISSTLSPILIISLCSHNMILIPEIQAIVPSFISINSISSYLTLLIISIPPTYIHSSMLISSYQISSIFDSIFLSIPILYYSHSLSIHNACYSHLLYFESLLSSFLSRLLSLENVTLNHSFYSQIRLYTLLYLFLNYLFIISLAVLIRIIQINS